MLSEIVFGKPLNEIELSDLKTFFLEGQEESSILEFKTGEVVVDSLYKEVCAFLNTEGGVIVIGAPREDKRKVGKNSEVVYCQGELTPSNFRGKDWLSMKISSNISPAPTGINIQEFITPEGNYFIIDVAQSITPPHQNSLNGVYHIRLEREAKHAPHGLVEAMFSKRQKPKLKFKGNIATSEHANYLDFGIKLSNISPYPTEKISYSLTLINIKNIPEHSAVGHTIADNKDGSYTLNYTHDIVLWKGLDIATQYTFLPKDEPFMYAITAWSRDAELISSKGIIDSTGKVIEFENDETENKKGTQYYFDLLESLKKPLGSE